LCIAIPWYVCDVVNGEDNGGTLIDDFNYNATFMDVETYPVMLIDNVTGEQTLISNSEFVERFA